MLFTMISLANLPLHILSEVIGLNRIFSKGKRTNLVLEIYD